RQGYMIKNMERKCVTTYKLWKVHRKVDQFLHEIVPQLAERATNDLIESNLKPMNNVVQVHPTTTTSTNITSSTDIQQQLYLKMKRSLQDQANDLALWEVLKRKFEKSSTSNTSYMNDDFHSQHHDDHQDNDAPPKGGKEMEATLNDMLSNQFRNDEEYAYHLEQATHFMKNQTVWESRQEDIRRTIPKPLVFYKPQRNPNEPPRYLYNKDLFFLKNGNTEEKK
ncbi:hypothetical protein Tco_0994405, partial [Tanacetum coccineum]